MNPRAVSNPSYLTMDYINYLNSIGRRLSCIKPADIITIYGTQNYILASYTNTDISPNALVQHCPVDRIKSNIEYIYNSKQSSMTAIATIKLNDKSVQGVNYAGTITRGSMRTLAVPVPQGYDGNNSYIKFFIDDPKLVASLVSKSYADGTIDDEVLYGYRTDAHWTVLEMLSKIPNYTIENPLEYYSYNTGLGHIQLEYSKSKDYVTIYYGSDSVDWTKTLFSDEIEKIYGTYGNAYTFTSAGEDATVSPIVKVRVEFYKNGV